MVRGLYTAYTGMNNEQKRLDIISNNLANAATAGYKSEGVTSQSFDNLLTIKINDSSEFGLNRNIGSMSLGVKLGEVYTDYSQGAFHETGNTFDLAIEGNGFFAVNVKNTNGEDKTLYTRDGNFKMDKEGYVVDSEGNHLIGSGGYLQVPTDASDLIVDTDGNVYADGEYVDRIEIKNFEDTDYLKKYGTNMYEAADGATEADASGLIHQGFIEQSNVNTVSEMVDMITITRAYEANQKVIQTVDSTLQKSCNDLGKV